MKGKRTLLALIMTLALCSLIFAAGGKEGQGKKTTDYGLDISERVELQFWMLGNAPKDLQMIEDKVNELALRDLNCTVKFNYTTWTDWPQKYRLLLTSGQPADLIFTAEWTEYQRYARSGAYLELDDIIPAAAPVLLDFIGQEYWDGVKVGGDIYTIPNIWKEYVYDGFEYREDLRKKYNLPEINSVETIEKYMETVLANEAGLIGFAEGKETERFDQIVSLTAELLHPWLDRGMPHYGMVADNDNPREMYQYWGSDEHLADLKLFKKWADKGFWSRSILSSNEDPATMFQEGKLAGKMAGINPVKYSQDIIAIGSNHPEWKVGYFPFPMTSGIVHPVHPTHNGYAVPISSKHPERAVAFFSLMLTDKEYNRLTNYGIEGVHYNVVDGYYQMVGDQTSNGFQRESMNCWAWRNPEYMLFDPSFDPVLKIFEEFDKFQTPDLYNGFAEDYTPFQSERTALQQIMSEYLAPLQAGLIDDVEAGLAKFMSEAKKAGLEKVQKMYVEQWIAYCDDMGIK